MFLLSEQLIRRYCQRKRIGIKPADYFGESFGTNCYYFHLGQIVYYWNDGQWHPKDVAKDAVMLAPGQHVQVSTHESFTLASDVLGVLGTHTELAVKHGLYLLHGPTIDPLWDGPLQLALVNLGMAPRPLVMGTRIGKLLFYDVSDTALEEDAVKPRHVPVRERLMADWGNANPDDLDDAPTR